MAVMSEVSLASANFCLGGDCLKPDIEMSNAI